ncbi:alpha/beta-hydrolase [Stipitochalara longipes BDJ]|nr:alpha/beta-hydrolase [Stipitochalara longipes BDJ]
MSCPACFLGAIHTGTPTGTTTTLHNLTTYITPPPPLPSPSPSTIILLTDAFGFNLPNSFLLADHYAASTGFRVLVPSWIPGGGVPLSTLSLMETMTKPVAPFYHIFSQLKRLWAFVRVMVTVLPFAIRIRPAPKAILEFARAVKAELKEEGKGGKLGVAGICVGGMHSTQLCKESAVEGGEERLVDAQFCAHPAGLKIPGDVVEAVKEFKVPYSFAIGDWDFLKVERVLELQAALRREVGTEEEGGYEVRVYAGVGHGFAVRASKEKKDEDEAAEEAARQAAEWFKRYL